MLNIELGVSGTFNVVLDSKHPQYDRAYLVVRSLLTALEVRSNVWQVSYDDVLWLQEKLNEVGLRNVGKTIDEDAYQWLEYLNQRVAYNDWLKTGGNNSAVEGLLQGKIKAKLYEDQLTAVSYLTANSRVGLFDPMGSGKSLISLSVFVALNFKKLLIICPKGVIADYMRGVSQHTYLRAVALPSGRKKALDFLTRLKSSDFDVLFVHPENLVGTKAAVSGPVLAKLLEVSWDMIVVDEFHKFKNPEAKRSKCIVQLLREAVNPQGGVVHALPMTGTPISESPTNAFVFLQVTRFGRLPRAASFENYFTRKTKVTMRVPAGKGKKGKRTVKIDKVIGYKNLDFLKLLLDRRSLRRTKHDLKGFPDKTTMVREVSLSGKQHDLYRVLAGELLASLPQSSKINLAKILASNAVAIRLRQVLTHPALIGEEGGSAKFDELEGLLEELFTDPEQKAIVWTEYRKGVDLLFDRFNERWGVVKIYGGVDINDDLRRRFEDSERPRIAAAIPAKGGEGLDFLARARTAFYIDRPYSFTLYSQSLDRVHRRVSGAVNLTRVQRIRAQPATIVFLDAVGTIDEAVKSTLEAKADLAEALLTSDGKLIEMGKAELIRLLK